MSPYLYSVKIILSLSLLLIGLTLCHGASLQRLRIKRDTRDIPSNMFKPLGNPTQNTDEPSKTNPSEYTFSESSAAEAHTVNANSSLRQTDEDYDDNRNFNGGSSWSGNSKIANPFRNPTRTVFRTSPFDDQNDPEASFRRSSFGQTSHFGPSGFNGNEYSSMPLSIQTGPQRMFPEPFPTNFLVPGRSFNNNNFYRSESYSYNSDGNGPPQVHRSVYDSRLGHGIKAFNK